MSINIWRIVSIFLGVFFYLSLSFAEEYQIKQITHDTYYKTEIQHSDRYVAWIGQTGSNYYTDNEVFAYDKLTKRVIRITENSTIDYLPKLDGTSVAWIDNTSPSNIYAHAFGTEINDRISSTHTNSFDIENGKIVIGDYFGSVYLYDTNAPLPSEVKISENGYNCFYPKIDGDYVVWHQDETSDSDDDSEIYWYKDDTNSGLTITNNDYDDRYPQINDGLIVWKAYNNPGVSNDYDLLLFNTETYTTINLSTITPQTSKASYIFMDNGVIVWRAYDGQYNEIYTYDTTTGQKEMITGTYSSSYVEGIDNRRILLKEYETGNPVLYLYNIDSKEKIKVTEGEEGFLSGNDIVFLKNNELYIASPPSLEIINVGDGESIKLTWAAYEAPGKKIIYKVFRKEEALDDIDSNWIQVNVKHDELTHNKDTNSVTFIDTKKENDPDEQTDPDYLGPIRGEVFDYKVEVFERAPEPVIDPQSGLSTYTIQLAELGKVDIDGDGVDDTYQKGVSEPFILLIRGYGPDEEPYWKAFKDENLLDKKFREADEEYDVNGVTFNKPKTIWDTAITYKSSHDSYIYPNGDDNRIGQLDSYVTGAAILEELTGIYYMGAEKFKKKGNSCWLSELAETCNRSTDKGTIFLDYLPEHIYIYSHSMGGPNSRYFEYLLNKYRAQEKDDVMRIPYVEKNVMLSPANCGSVLAWEFCSKEGFMLLLSEIMSDKKVFWPASHFLKPNNVALFNNTVKPFDKTKYYFLGGHNWYGGGFGPENASNSSILVSMLKALYGYIVLLQEEADNLITTEMKNDTGVTVKMQRGQFTNKVWNILDKQYGFGTNPVPYEFRGNPAIENHFNVEPTMALNHYYGVMQTPAMMDLAWYDLDIPPRLLQAPDLVDEESPPSPPYPPSPDTVKLYSEGKRIYVSSNDEEKTFQLRIPTTDSWYIAVTTKDTAVNINLQLTTPDGQTIDGESGSLPENIYYTKDNSGAMYSLITPTEGLWQVNLKVTGGENTYVNYLLFSETNMQIIPLSVDKEVAIAESVELSVQLLEDELPILNGVVTAKITKNEDGTETVLTLLDDGIIDNGIAADGIYGNTFLNTNEEGAFSIAYEANVTASNGNAATLKAQSAFEVVFRNEIDINDIIDVTLKGDTPPYDGLDVELDLNFAVGGDYCLTAQLYDTNNNYVSSGEGQITSDSGGQETAYIQFAGEDICASGIDGPYVIKNFVIRSASSLLDSKINESLQMTTDIFSASDFEATDTDGDGLSDSMEDALGTDKNLSDTDMDGLSDYAEVMFDGDINYTPGLDTDPLNEDTDTDNFIDGIDSFPLDASEWADTDNDGVGNNSDYFPQDATRWESPDQIVEGIEAFDFNIDGQTDILWQDSESGAVYVWLSGSNDDGFIKIVDSAWEIKGVEDLDGDFKNDIVLKNKETGDLYIWLMDGDSIKAEGTLADMSATYTLNTDILDQIDWKKTNYFFLKDTDSGKIYIWLKKDISEPPLRLQPICHGAFEMNIYEGDNFQEDNWQPYNTWITYSLSPGDGEKVLNACFRDDTLAELTAPPVTIVVDRENPQVTLSAPLNNTTVYTETITVQGTINEPCYKVLVNGQQANITNTNFSVDISLTPGENNIQATAIDLNGNQAKSEEITVTLG